jgi:hypothetical protein
MMLSFKISASQYHAKVDVDEGIGVCSPAKQSGTRTGKDFKRTDEDEDSDSGIDTHIATITFVNAGYHAGCNMHSSATLFWKLSSLLVV